MQYYMRHASRVDIYQLVQVRGKGLWNGQNPFTPLYEPDQQTLADNPVAVLTGAGIRLRSLRRF